MAHAERMRAHQPLGSSPESWHTTTSNRSRGSVCSSSAFKQPAQAQRPRVRCDRHGDLSHGAATVAQAQERTLDQA